MLLKGKVIITGNDHTVMYSWFRFNTPYTVKYKGNSLIAHFATKVDAKNYVKFMERHKEDLLVRKLKGN